MLLVRCPSATYPRGRDMQRVTCGSTGSFYYDDGDDAKMTFLFDSTRHPTNCQTQAHPAAPHGQEVLAHAAPHEPAGHEAPSPAAAGALPAGARPARARVGAKRAVAAAGGDPLLSPAGPWQGLTGEAADDADADADGVDDDDGPAAGAEEEVVLSAAAGSAGRAAVLVEPSGGVLPVGAAGRAGAAGLAGGLVEGPPAARLPGAAGGRQGRRGGLQAQEASLLERTSRPKAANVSALEPFSEQELLARLERTRLLLESR
ncbi:unnamed protein product [Prorocentrum cordatum]|uniref:Uncharacterized protein n=1 Tax=Prorocentrum cordatum TaxID=2364126 RepID=A0ABN9XN64_9DINO|nr:unnamed protein product [Polarella glacialis]